MSRAAEKSGASFLKVVTRRDFTRLLRLPPVLMEKYGSNMLQKNMKLRMESGRTWEVKVEEEDGGLFCFSRGWDVFAQDVGLKLGEILVFMLNDGEFISVVDVCVYETSGWKKEFPGGANLEEKEKMSSPLYYEFDLISPYNKSRFTPKRSFARAAGLVGKKRVEVVGEHRKQWVELEHSRSDALRVDMTRGWPEFRSGNRLVFGKRYSFQYNPTHNIIQVKEPTA